MLCQGPSGQPLIARWLSVEHGRQHPPSRDIPLVVGCAVGCPIVCQEQSGGLVLASDDVD
ncbi:hypothetical protein J1N35_006407 [Gossypium stocksii]|uniref:Uncharacterized protein n=1 Tax=Gossypium stocksii TaxID=47602 RepID=A0A9D3WGH2_9ROSI|nr:hypothetical protein J1N35_006407 [Gossypium stocksii]